MQVRRLKQEEAEEYIRCLFKLWNPNDAGNLFCDVFCDEGKRATNGLGTWALPENERIYFIANRGEKTYLYGINPQYPLVLNISSIGKIVQCKLLHSTRSLTIRSDSVLCLRELIEKSLVPLAKNSQKRKIDAFPKGNGVDLFEALLLSHSNSQIDGISNATWESYVCSLHLL